MLGQLHLSAALRWVGQAETAVTDLSSDYLVMYLLGFFAFSIFVCWCLIINLQLYQMCPGWGPIRKFDSDGTEEMRINQLLMHEEKLGVGHNLKGDTRNVDENVAFLQGVMGQAHGQVAGMVDKAKEKAKALRDGSSDLEVGGATERSSSNGLWTGFQETYGTIGPCTWGYCESPNQWGEEKYDPRYGQVVVRHGFTDTQWMRSQSRTWAKDEQHFMLKNGMTAPPLTLQEENACRITQRMVIERGGY